MLVTGQDLARRLDLAFHRVRVAHGVPAVARPLTRWLDRVIGSGFDARERQRTREEAESVRARFVGRPLELTVTRWPEGLPADTARVPVEVEPLAGAVRCLAAPVTPAIVRALTEHLRIRGLAAVRRIEIGRLLEVLDGASRRWLDPGYAPRGLAIEAIHRLTGFSREMVIRSIDLEMRSSLRLDLLRTLWSELGNARALDRRSWTPTGEAPTVAFGPSLLAAVFSSNIPALPHLTYMRGLAVKAPVLGKVATFEPIFAGLYIDTLRELCPELGPALGAVWWKGGDVEIERAFFEQADAVVAYGSDRSIAALERSIPGRARRSMHAERVGVGMLTREALGGAGGDLAGKVAHDFAMFDGQACLAPMVYLIEGTLDEGLGFARSVGGALEELQAWLPRRRVSAEESAARFAVMERWEARAVFASREARVVRAPNRSDWAGLVTAGDFEPQPVGDRLFHLHCVVDLEAALPTFERFSGNLQNVALGAREPRRGSLAMKIAALGASRVNEPGRMPTPSMMWHHDGRMCLSDLVRWADLA